MGDEAAGTPATASTPPAPGAQSASVGGQQAPPQQPTAAGAVATGAAATGEAGGGSGGTGGGGAGGAKLEASLLASLQQKIKARAAAPEKLKTTGVAFQAVDEVRHTVCRRCCGQRGRRKELHVLLLRSVF